MLLYSFENSEWIIVPDLREQKQKAIRSAKGCLRKDARINIRISSSDLTPTKQKAVYKRLPYQTLILSILYKYSADHLKI